MHFQEQLASLLRTAEELRIKGLAEVSWNDENGDSRRNKNRTHNIRNLLHSNETAVTTAKPLQQPKRHSFSNSHSNQMNPNEIDPLAESFVKGVDEPVQVTKSGANQFLLPVNSPQRSVEETMPTVKKKRGRPPLDDDFDSYSTPKISHVESTANSYDVHADHTNAMYDDNSHESPSAILEQSMEVSMTCENEEPTLMPIQPKIERPDTPASPKQDYYDENDYNPSSPMDESNDPGLISQVSCEHACSHFINELDKSMPISILLLLGNVDSTRRRGMARCYQNERLFGQRTSTTILGRDFHQTGDGSDQIKGTGNEKGGTTVRRIVWHIVWKVS